MCLICCYSYAFIIDGDGGSGWIAEPTSIIISGGGSSSGGWEEYDPAKTYYTVTLLDDDRVTILASKLVEEGSDVTIDFTPVKSGHVFTTWTDDNNVPVTQITNISADTRLFAMWDNGRYSITYYVDGEYQGIQFYDENDTITPLAAPAPYDAEIDSCFVGWYNIPQDFKMPAHSIIATATIDESYYINYVWEYDSGSTGYNGRQFTGLTPQNVRNVKNNGYCIVKIPPVHNSYTVFAMKSSMGSIFGGAEYAFTSAGVEFPTEVYIGDNFTKKISLNGIVSTTGVLSNVASVTIDFKGYNTYTDPYQGDFNNYNLIGAIFNNAKKLKYLDLSGCTNITQLGSYDYSSANLILTGATALETFIFPPNIDKLCINNSFKTCVNPIIFPEVATLTMFCGTNPGNPSANYFLNCATGPLHFVVASGTRFVFGNNHNYRIIDDSNNITFTFESSYLPQSDPDHPAIFARGSHITIRYHSSRGEWQDPSFKENSTLWGTLSQYTWVDLDAETE